MNTHIAPWVIPGETVYELHCTTRDYSVKKTRAATVARVGGGWIVLDNGARYRASEGTHIEPVRYHRDDPKQASRYYLLVGPNDSHVTN